MLEHVVANDGGLMAYFADEAEMYHGAAVVVDKVLKGATPADPLQKSPDARQELSKFASALPLRRLPSSTENSMTICRGR
jgi:hypothetical protein